MLLLTVITDIIIFMFLILLTILKIKKNKHLYIIDGLCSFGLTSFSTVFSYTNDSLKKTEFLWLFVGIWFVYILYFLFVEGNHLLELKKITEDNNKA